MSTGLGSYSPRKEKVVIDNDADFFVRGIAFRDVTELLRKHGPVAVAIYAQVKAASNLGQDSTLAQLVMKALEDFPEAVAEVIALAADDTSQAALENAGRLPLPIQMEALEKIIGLTFAGEAEVKKLVEIVTRMLEGVSRTAQVLSAPTMSDSGRGSFVSV